MINDAKLSRKVMALEPDVLLMAFLFIVMGRIRDWI